MNNLDFMLLQKNDSDIPALKRLHNLPSVKKSLSISNFFKIFFETETVF